MIAEGKQSVEWIKQEIEFQKENLKFLNSFYLPIGTGLTVIFYGNTSKSYRIGWIIAGMFSLAVLTLRKKKVQKNIHKLIKEL